MKKTIKILTIATIILSMIFAFVPNNVFAATIELKDNGSITVDAAEERNITLYKLFNIDKAEEIDGEEQYIYSFGATDVAEYFAGEGYATVKEAVAYINTLATDSDLNVFAMDIVDSISGTAGKTRVAFEGLTSGYYLVIDNTTTVPEGSTISAVLLGNVVFTAEKTSYEDFELKVDSITAPEIKVNGEDWDSANKEEDVTFTITQTIPTINDKHTTYTFNVVNTLSKGLNYNDDIAVKVGGADYTDYEVEETADGDNTVLTIKFLNLSDLRDNAGKDIKITYTAEVDATDFEHVNTSEVYTQYSANPNGTDKAKTGNDSATVYTYQVTVNKVDADNKALEGAEFTLTGEGVSLKVTDDTKVITGLKAGEYTLVETKAPEGYPCPEYELKFTIADKAEETVNATIADTTSDDAAKGFLVVDNDTAANEFVVTVINVKGSPLPTTGGMGTKIFTTVGIILMVSAAAVLVYRNKKSK